MKKIAFTVAFGSDIYINMANCLKKTVNLYSQSVDFKIFGEGFYTPFNSILKGRPPFNRTCRQSISAVATNSRQRSPAACK